MARTKTTGRIYKSKALSLDPKMLKDTNERAASLGLSFSEYVRKVLVQDIYQGGDLVIKPKKPKGPKE